MDASQAGQMSMTPQRLLSALTDTHFLAPKQGGVLKMGIGVELKQYVRVSQSSTRVNTIVECFSSGATAHHTSSSAKCDILLLYMK